MLYENLLIQICFRIKHGEEKSEFFPQLFAKLASVLRDKKVNEADLKTQKRISSRKIASTENCVEDYFAKDISLL